MKKVILIATLALALAVTATAQSYPKAAGLRVGYGIELSYEHSLKSDDFIGVDFGYSYFDDLSITGTYNFMVAEPRWTSRGEWGFYVGPGISLGGADRVNEFYVALAVQIGLEYTFWFPLQLSFDLVPKFGFVTGNDVEYYKHGLNGFIPSIGVRYRF